MVVAGLFVRGYKRSEEREDEFSGERRRLRRDLGEDAGKGDLQVVDVERHFGGKSLTLWECGSSLKC